MGREDDHTRRFFLDHDGVSFHYPTGHWYKVSCSEMPETPEHPAGLKYALAFFDPNDQCLVRFDNSHAVKIKGKANPDAFDHWHRVSSRSEELVPYKFITVVKLLDDFFEAIDRHLPPEQRSS